VKENGHREGNTEEEIKHSKILRVVETLGSSDAHRPNSFMGQNEVGLWTVLQGR